MELIAGMERASAPADRAVLRWHAHMAATSFFVFLGAAAGLAIHDGVRPPTGLVVAVITCVTLWGAFIPRVSRLNLLPRMMIFVYALPFSALLGYLFDPNYLWVFTLHGYAIGQDREVMSILTLTGLAGICGFVAGIHLVTAFSPTTTERVTAPDENEKHTLGLFTFGALTLLAIELSVLSSAPETLFQSTYAGRVANSTATNVNFAAAFLISYVIFVLLWIDIEREGSRFAGRWKIAILAVAIAYVVVDLQVLRGDRESSGLIAALAALYLTSPTRGREPSRARVRRRVRRSLVPLALLVAVFIALGKGRESLSDTSEQLSLEQMLVLGFTYNTWTAVLWTNLGTAWQYQQGMLDYRLGSTYVDYALSLPPGVISKAYGYERPEESWRGIAGDDPAGVSAGGLHAVIAPFKNFGGLGVVAILFLYGVLVASVERANRSYGLLARLLWGATFCGSFLWFWYGDMTMIRALMAAVLLFILYRIAISPHYVFRRSAGRPLAAPPLVRV